MGHARASLAEKTKPSCMFICTGERGERLLNVGTCRERLLDELRPRRLLKVFVAVANAVLPTTVLVPFMPFLVRFAAQSASVQLISSSLATAGPPPAPPPRRFKRTQPSED
eukprot:1176054-Prorocentrum_minimum.AAC.6